MHENGRRSSRRDHAHYWKMAFFVPWPRFPAIGAPSFRPFFWVNWSIKDAGESAAKSVVSAGPSAELFGGGPLEAHRRSRERQVGAWRVNKTILLLMRSVSWRRVSTPIGWRARVQHLRRGRNPMMPALREHDGRCRGLGSIGWRRGSAGWRGRRDYVGSRYAAAVWARSYCLRWPVSGGDCRAVRSSSTWQLPGSPRPSRRILAVDTR